MKEGIIQIFLWTVSILSGFIAYEFYTTKNGRLRLLMIELFSAKSLLYAGTAILFGIKPSIDFGYMGILLLLPMFIVMIKLHKFIRLKQ